MKTLYSVLTAGALLLGTLVVLAPSMAMADTQATNFDSFNTATISSQNGWTMTGAYDAAVVDTASYGYTSSISGKALRISDAVTNGSFGDQLFAAPLTDSVGETVDTSDGVAPGTVYSEGTKSSHFEVQFDLASVSSTTQQAGLHMTMSPDRGDGSRMSYLRFEDQADGIHVFFDDVQGTVALGVDGCTTSVCGNFVESDIKTLSRSVPHTIKLTLDAIDGASNDIVDVYIDGVLVKAGTSWEDYYRFDPEASADQAPRLIKTVLFRESGAATPANAGNGFLVDNFSIASGGSAGPVVVLPSFTSTPVTDGLAGTAYTYNITTGGTAGTISSTAVPAGLTFTDNGNGTAVISGTPTAASHASVTLTDTNPSGSVTQNFTFNITPAAVWVDAAGSDSNDGSQASPFLTIQKGVDSVNAGGTVNVNNGAYSGHVTIANKNNITIAGQSAGGVTFSETSPDSFGYGFTVDHASGASLSNLSVSSPVGAAIGYALHAYKADGLTVSNSTFSGPGVASTHVGGVDINTSNNVTLNNVSSSNYYKNGFAVTAQYVSADAAADGVTFNGVTSSNNGWTGIAFYTIGNDHSPLSIGGSHSLAHVTFTGTNTISNDGSGSAAGAGIFVEGTSDANVGTAVAPTNTVTSNGTLLDLSHVAFSGNPHYDIYNYQTAPVNAVGATFGGALGNSMDATARTTEDGKINDHLDNAALGLVSYWSAVTTTNPDSSKSTIFASATTTSNSAGSGVTVETDIPAGITITGDSSWDGTLQAPTATTATVTIPGFDTPVTSAIAIGSSLSDLTFDKAVKLTFSGMAGNNVGWFNHAGGFSPIAAICADNTQATNDGLAAGADCKLEVGGDLVVWTKHFTTFVTYTQTTGGVSGGGSGSSGGGSGGSTTVTSTGGSVTTTTGTIGGGQVLGASTFNFSSDLTIGSTGDAVTALQQALIDAGFLKIASPTGYFGPLTQAAVKLYQGAHGITATGYVGPLTRASLNMGTITTADQEAHAMLIVKIKAALADVVTKLMAIRAVLNARGN